MIEYTIVEKWREDEFLSEVRSLIGKGWLPHGGICTTENRSMGGGSVGHYLQAMTRIPHAAPEKTA